MCTPKAGEGKVKEKKKSLKEIVDLGMPALFYVVWTKKVEERLDCIIITVVSI